MSRRLLRAEGGGRVFAESRDLEVHFEITKSRHSVVLPLTPCPWRILYLATMAVDYQPNCPSRRRVLLDLLPPRLGDEGGEGDGNARLTRRYESVSDRAIQGECLRPLAQRLGGQHGSAMKNC